MPSSAAPGRPIVVGHLHHTFYEVAARVLAGRLRDLGHEVALVEGAHGELYPRLAAGEIDMLVATWAPHLHAPFYDPVKRHLTTLGTLFEGAGAFWAVPAAVPEATVAEVADLARPEVAARMARDILAPGAAIAVAERAEAAFEGYGLAAAGYSFTRLAADAEWIAALKDRLDGGQWFVTPLWRPHFANKAFALRPLAEPRGLMGGLDSGLLTANKAFAQTLPPVTRAALARLAIGLEGVTEMDYLVNVEGLSAEAAAERWGRGGSGHRRDLD